LILLIMTQDASCSAHFSRFKFALNASWNFWLHQTDS